MAEEKTEKIEREYTIPLRHKWKKVPRYKRANKAIRAIKEFLARHMKVRDRDLKKIKIDKYLNEEVWFRGIRKPPAKIKVKAIKESGSEEVKVELLELPEKLKFKKAREEKREQKAADLAKDKTEKHEHKEEKQEEKPEEEKKEEKEKKSAVVEEGKKLGKDAAKKEKHQAKSRTKQPKRQPRKALAK
tara:strand:+ start:186 stop:749 length:564 start_codon:yes stop_codon:yes gene_type:complete